MCKFQSYNLFIWIYQTIFYLIVIVNLSMIYPTRLQSNFACVCMVGRRVLLILSATYAWPQYLVSRGAGWGAVTSMGGRGVGGETQLPASILINLQRTIIGPSATLTGR